ncbi:NAD(P)-binding protein [Hyaloscypha variabilis F]|uniref:L-gulonate 3-dehydrogenase n=1 Tax=Hyaloscypha variabilis (strain UAMH 11265 / GT02V1 / F) TaxID=1149755 RepID=A0A2J6QUT4_HYAVF|nr:NAD(P)-binding protein [Hyaloscypha variabilis F]
MDRIRVTLIGAGTIGLSFAASHLTQARDCQVTIYDTRPDIKAYIYQMLPGYLSNSEETIQVDSLFASGRLRLAASIQDAVQNADIVQEQGPENVSFKQAVWPEIEAHAKPECLFWSSTSGITASKQSESMRSSRRLIVVHPYNPPHIMPLLEIVPGPDTDPQLVEQAVNYWKYLGKVPVVLGKECTGFVANRLAFALLREAINLVNEGIISVKQADTIVENSMGPRWAVAGPFKSYHLGGGAGGIEGFMKNVGSTIQACWEDLGVVNMGQGWESSVLEQTSDAYGEVKTSDLRERDQLLKEIIDMREGGLGNIPLRK